MIELLVIRHGVAEDRDSRDEKGGHIEDHERRLTAKGRTRMAKVAEGLHWICPDLDGIASSPLVRAVETAGLMAEAYDGMDVTELDALRPEAAPEELVQWLADRPEGTRLAVVGHEPHLSTWCSWMLCGARQSFLRLKKGGACLLSLPSPVTPGVAELLWLATSDQLRRWRK